MSSGACKILASYFHNCSRKYHLPSGCIDKEAHGPKPSEQARQQLPTRGGMPCARLPTWVLLSGAGACLVPAAGPLGGTVGGAHLLWRLCMEARGMHPHWRRLTGHQGCQVSRLPACPPGKGCALPAGPAPLAESERPVPRDCRPGWHARCSRARSASCDFLFSHGEFGLAL